MNAQTHNSESPGYHLAAAVMPFMFSKHTASREECIAMIQKPVDRLAENLDRCNTTIALMKDFIAGKGVTINGLTYHRGINNDSFLIALGY